MLGLGLLLGVIIGLLFENAFFTTTVSDTIKLNPDRSPIQQKQDAIMQLKNEIANSSALKFRKNKKTGITKVSIKLKT